MRPCARTQALGRGLNSRDAWCGVVPTWLAESGSQQWAAWSLNLSTATSSVPPSSVQIALVGFFVLFCFCYLFFFFKKELGFCHLSRDSFKNTSKGYYQVMKMLDIIKDDTKIFTEIFTKAILKIIDLRTEHTI